MSSSLGSLYLTVRAVLAMVAPVCVVAVVVFGAKPAFAATWAPMCDLSASSVIAPLVAPPVDSGEITVCPNGSVLEDFEQALLLQGGGPVGEPQPGLHWDLPEPRVLPDLSFVGPRFAALGELLAWPDVGVGPAAAFGRSLDRPPCA